jgi:flagellar biosynthesis/type III secretory pathway M-ring protein FliF/YscJ
MPEISRAETYFIASMMFLILVLCVAAVYFFIKTYRREMREKEEQSTSRQKPDAQGEQAHSPE